MRAEAAYTDASQRLGAARGARPPRRRRRAHQLQVELLRLAQLAEQTERAARPARRRAGRGRRQLEELQERRVTGEARFEESGHAARATPGAPCRAGRRVIEAERKLAEAREQQRSAGAPGAGGAVRAARAGGAARRAAARHRDRGAAGARTPSEAERSCRASWPRLTDAAAQAGLQDALALKLEREQALGAKRSEYDDLTASCAASDEQRLQLEREPGAAARAHHRAAAQGAGGALGGAQYMEQLTGGQADLEALAAAIEEGGVRLPACRARSTASTARSRRWARSTWRRWRS